MNPNLPFHEQTSNEDFTSDDPPVSDPVKRPPPLMSKPTRPPRQGPQHDLFSNYRKMNAFGNYMGGYSSNGPIGPPCPPFPMGPMGPMPPMGGMPPMGPLPPMGPMPPMGGGRMGSNMDFGLGPGLMRRQGGPMRRPPTRGPSRENPVSYLSRCGVPIEKFQDFPRDYFYMIEPDYCAVCDLNFDSFAQSKTHYQSRNHWKNSKKWLNDWSDNFAIPKIQQKSIPLKSRDLYCELCNVQITSKVHADSHYSGRNHRAVVDGRRDPKNTALLKPKNYARYDALIKREKKQLKLLMKRLETEAVEETPNEDGEKEAKPIDQSLYCEICKTSVTCSEQMTAHMNGKRHLNKEKNHILQMMKGNRDDAEEYQDEYEGEENEGNAEKAQDGGDNQNEALQFNNGEGALENEMEAEGEKQAEVEIQAEVEMQAEGEKQGGDGWDENQGESWE